MVLPRTHHAAAGAPMELCGDHDQELFPQLCYTLSQQTFSQEAGIAVEQAACRQAWDSRASFPALWFFMGTWVTWGPEKQMPRLLLAVEGKASLPPLKIAGITLCNIH